MNLIHTKNLAIRSMEDSEADYLLMQKWLTNPAVKEWYAEENLSIEAICSKYKPRTSGINYVQSAIIEWEHKPVGYIQFYKTLDEK